MRVSKRSNAVSVAGAVAGKLRLGVDTTLEAIGLESIHRAVTALADTTKYLEADGIRPIVVIKSEPRIVAGVERQAVIFEIMGARFNVK